VGADALSFRYCGRFDRGGIMGEIVIAPQGRDAIEIGGFIDDAGDRFVAVNFRRDDGDPVIVTFRAALFQDFARHVGKVAEAVRDARFWETVPRG
jgi:hypothetical protein